MSYMPSFGTVQHPIRRLPPPPEQTRPPPSEATPIQVEEGRCGADGAAECGVITIEGVIYAVWSILFRPSVTFFPDSFFASILSRVHEELLPTEPHAGFMVPTAVSLDHSPGDDMAAHGLLPSSVIPFMGWII